MEEVASLAGICRLKKAKPGGSGALLGKRCVSQGQGGGRWAVSVEGGWPWSSTGWRGGTPPGVASPPLAAGWPRGKPRKTTLPEKASSCRDHLFSAAPPFENCLSQRVPTYEDRSASTEADDSFHVGPIREKKIAKFSSFLTKKSIIQKDNSLKITSLNKKNWCRSFDGAPAPRGSTG